MKYGRLALVAYALTLSIGVIAAESIPTLDGFFGNTFPDNSDVRKQYWTNLITAPKEQVWSFTEKTLASTAGQVRVRSIKRAGDFLVQFSNSQGGAFSEYSQGSYVIQRDSKTGYILQAKIFLGDDPTCYARLYPQAEGTRVDVIMYGAVLKKGLYVSGLIYYILAKPFSDIVDETKRSFDWASVFGLAERSKAASLAQDIRASYGPQQQPSAPALPSTPPTYAQATVPLGASAPAPLPTNSALPSLVAKATTIDALMSSVTSRGLECSEFSLAPVASPGAAIPVFAALALSDDSDPLVPGQPYRNFPHYEPGKGISLSGLRAALYLDAFSSTNAVYALVGDSLRILVAPNFDPSGRFHFTFFADGKEVAWDDILGGKDKAVRVVRINLGS